jgi:hypothetical protein
MRAHTFCRISNLAETSIVQNEISLFKPIGVEILRISISMANLYQQIGKLTSIAKTAEKLENSPVFFIRKLLFHQNLI